MSSESLVEVKDTKMNSFNSPLNSFNSLFVEDSDNNDDNDNINNSSDDDDIRIII
jgi:hypothetical protein